MKILLYTENLKSLEKSGLGKAIKHQMKALELNNIPYTIDPKDDFDIVHINYYGPSSYALAKKAKKLGKKVIYHAHSTEEDFRNSFILSNQVSGLFKDWIIKCYSLGDLIITPTPYSKKLLESYNIDKPIIDISNGIELDFFKKDVALGKKFRQDFGFKETDKVIIAVGLYIERKGIVDFVELAKRMPEYKFIWFGHSPLVFSTKSAKEAVNTKLDNLFFPGYVEPEVLKGAYSGADLYVFPTLEETEGIPVLEACAAKQNIIIRDIPVFDGWLKDGINVYKAKDVDEFEEKIKKIINHELPSLVEEGYKVALSREISQVGKQLISAYQQVLTMDEIPNN